MRLKFRKTYEKVNYYLGFILLFVVFMGDFYYLTKHYTLDVSLILAFFSGLVFYGILIEYCFHRFLFHGNIEKIAYEHLVHHDTPKAYLSTPFLISMVIYALVFFVFSSLFGDKLGFMIAGGIIFGYLWYNIIHHLIHYIGYSNSKILNYFVVHHHLHHQQPTLHYRVSQPFWDHIFSKRRLGCSGQHTK